MKQAYKFGTIIIITILLTLGLSISLQSVIAAWQAPTESPPIQSNVYPPLTTGVSSETKLGNLTIAGNVNVLSTMAAYNFTVANNSLLATASIMNRLGVGTNNPSSRLDVDIGNLATTEGLHIKRSGASSYAYLNIENQTANPIFKVHESGNVGIGVGSPDERLDIAGSILADSAKIANSVFVVDTACPAGSQEIRSKNYYQTVAGGGPTYSYICADYAGQDSGQDCWSEGLGDWSSDGGYGGVGNPQGVNDCAKLFAFTHLFDDVGYNIGLVVGACSGDSSSYKFSVTSNRKVITKKECFYPTVCDVRNQGACPTFPASSFPSYSCPCGSCGGTRYADTCDGSGNHLYTGQTCTAAGWVNTTDTINLGQDGACI